MAASLAALTLGWAGPILAQGTPAPPVKPMAVVNGVPITAAEVEAVVKMGDPSPVALSQNQQRMRQMEALGLLIDNLLWRQYIARHTQPISPEELRKRVEEMKARLSEQSKSIADFCHDTHQTPEQLMAGITDHLRWTAYLRQHLSEAMVEKYYRDNKDFFDQVKVQASHIVIRLPQTCSEKEKTEARGKLEQIRKQLMSDPKADFAELAQKYSQDPTASQGGNVGEFLRKWVGLDESFARVAFALKPGEISDVVETDLGVELIKVTKRTPGKPSEYTKIKEVVREFCAEDLRQQILVRERKAARIEFPKD
jgi:peptidyl-prolyl cis-trans isomerase C